MKTLLAKFFSMHGLPRRTGMHCDWLRAIAHDLPQHFPAAPTDWGMIQQDCIDCKAIIFCDPRRIR